MEECWFHDDIVSRDEAEDRLRSAGYSEGLFLVRPSTTAQGDFVLSVVHKQQIIHYQIRRRGEDAIFSLSEETNVIIHGLDELISYYRSNPDSGLQHSLDNFVSGSLCPPSVRLHGTENLLHRAAKEGNVVVVSELLVCGDRNLSAKNADGQTAVHLACFYGREEVLKALIRYGANVNAADASGYSPLHFAAQANQAGVTDILLQVGRANPTLRNHITNWTPLHEAAWKGSGECVTALLRGGSPLRPRTAKNETPADLARANGKLELARRLEEMEDLPAVSTEEDWLHEGVTREQAIHLLTKDGDNRNYDGTFLVRRSRKGRNIFVLSLLCDNKTCHFEIIKQGIYYFIGLGPYLSTLAHIVHHYSRFADGLPTRLSRPVRPTPPRLPPSRDRMKPYPTNLKSLHASYENNESLRRVRHSRDNIPTEAVQVGDIIGGGEFGSVYEGLYLNERGERRRVAIKVLNTMQREDFIKEAELLMMLDHQCVVQLIGITDKERVMMILELVPLGSLLNFLHKHPDSVQTDREIPLWAAQIACGMMYLESRNFIHRDLAARNILLASKFQIKISDFGLSRYMDEHDYYKATHGGKWPIKWYAPECYSFGTFTTRSDVWSYGVVLWEMYSFGKQPYEDKTAVETVSFLEEGHRLSRPERAELETYSTMLWCWEYVPENRPSFQELFKTFVENPEYENIKELLRSQDMRELGLE